MLLKLRKNHVILYCLLATVLCVVLSFAMKLLRTLAVNLKLFPDAILSHEYLWTVFYDVCMALVMVLMLKKTGKISLLTKKGSGLFHSIKVSLFLLIYSGIVIIISLIEIAGKGYALGSFGSILLFLFAMCMVGVAEELVARAVIAETLLEHFGLSHAGILKACWLSSAIFGLMHFTNLAAVDFYSVTLQAIGAACCGAVFAAIYFRTGSLAMAVFVHAFNDFAGLFATGLFNVGSIAGTLSEMGQVGLVRLIPAAILAFVAFFLLRKSKTDEVKAQWENEVEEKTSV